ncbi:MAG: hypothetical protein LAT82_03050 [Nanoarchaeota archaeon]|nr:hypothetical protein [Nanoarchaeota archaeon]
MALDLGGYEVVTMRKPFQGFRRVEEFSGRNGAKAKYLLPQISQSFPLILDTNFVNLGRIFSEVRFLLENETDSDLAKYVLQSGYGQIKTIFNLAKEGRLVSIPQIVSEIKKGINATNCMIENECPQFTQLGYFKHFYQVNEAQELSKNAKSMFSMTKILPSYLTRNSSRYLQNLLKAEETATLIYDRINLSHKRTKSFVKTPSLEDMILGTFGVIINAHAVCTDDTDIYHFYDFLRSKDSNNKLKIPPICSSIRRLQIGDDSFSDTFCRFTN